MKKGLRVTNTGRILADKATASGFGFERTGSLNAPPQVLLSAVAKVRANEFCGKSNVSEYISKLEENPKFQRSKTGPDVLFNAGYDHNGGDDNKGCEKTVVKTGSRATRRWSFTMGRSHPVIR